MVLQTTQDHKISANPKENQPKAKNERAFAIASFTNKKTNRNSSIEMQLLCAGSSLVKSGSFHVLRHKADS